ncbi:MAG: DEAD/DEAH box helicase, partial [Planctomycetota bacterium]
MGPPRKKNRGPARGRGPKKKRGGKKRPPHRGGPRRSSRPEHPHATPRNPTPPPPPPQPLPEPSIPTETYRGFKLHEFQQLALNAIRKGSSVLVAAPTGAGKTLVADFAIEQAMEEGRRICYTAPVKALSNQKFRDFRKTMGERVGIMTGDVTINAGAPLLIMTTEVFRNTVFENPDNLDDCSAVIFDEIHYLDDRQRGTVWEESIIFAPEHVRIIGLSATIPNIDEMADWIRSIRELPVEVIQHEQRPVPLRNWVFHAEMGAVDLPQLRRQAKGRRKPRKWERHRGRGRHHRAKEHAALLDHIEENELLPCLYFSFSRRECEERAEENARRNLLTPGERDEILKSFDSMCDLYQLEGTDATNHLRNLAGHGILYHHAGLLPVHKEIVERLFTTGLIKLLFTTETFALGVNMPARTVGFASLKKFDGISVGWLMAREYGQMAGRAGRQGIDSVGDVFSRVEDRDLDFRALEHLFSGEIEPV